MSRVYKTVMVNGKPMKKWVEEYAVFEFDEDGRRIVPWSMDDDCRYYDYTEDGKRSFRLEGSFPEVFPTDDVKKNKFVYFTGNKKKLVREVGGFVNDVWTWFDKNNTVVERETDPIGVELDSNERVVRVYSRYGGTETAFEYEGNSDLLVHKITYDSHGSFYNEMWYEYDNDIIIHKKCADYEILYEYDDENHLIHEKSEDCEDKDDSDSEYNYERWLEYDESGNLIYGKKESSDGNVEICLSEYDDENHLIHRKWEYKNRSENFQDWYEYDDVWNLIHKRQEYANPENSPYDTWYEYDNEGHRIREEICSAGEKIEEYRWDNNGHILYYRFHETEKKYTWDDEGHLLSIKEIDLENRKTKESRWDGAGNLLYKKDWSGESWYEYDSVDDLISCHKKEKCSEWIMKSDGKVSFYQDYRNLLEFDSNGNIIHCKVDGTDEWYEYDFYPNGSIKKKTCLRGM